MRLHFFFFNDTATTEIYTLSLHDALPISQADDFSSRDIRSIDSWANGRLVDVQVRVDNQAAPLYFASDRKSTRLNSSHLVISYAVFCLKKKKHRPHYSSSSTTSRSERTTL